MTRESVNSILMEMERIREASYEADSAREEKRLVREYGRLWKVIEPYVSGATPYSPSPSTSSDEGGR